LGDKLNPSISGGWLGGGWRSILLNFAECFEILPGPLLELQYPHEEILLVGGLWEAHERNLKSQVQVLPPLLSSNGERQIAGTAARYLESSPNAQYSRKKKMDCRLSPSLNGFRLVTRGGRIAFRKSQRQQNKPQHY